MRALVYSPSFKKKLKQFLKKNPQLKAIIQSQFKLLSADPFVKQLGTHKLSGKLKECWGASITYEYRLVFYMEKNAIYLLAIGTHEEVY